MSDGCNRVIRLTLNGRVKDLVASPFARLSDTLRQGSFLGGDDPHVGTKVGCDAGDCGACTVVMNGQAVCACLVASAHADGAVIETIEGWSRDPIGARLVDAFVKLGAVQCGICTPGMIGAARALLAVSAQPSKAQIMDAIGGVLCRCTGYVRIVDAIDAVARGTTYPIVTDGGVGARTASRNAEFAAKGYEHYGADAAAGGALTISVVRSPHACARFTFGDLEAFAAAHDLRAVLTARDVPGANSFGIFPTTKDQPVFAEGRVRYRGEAVAALVGTQAAVAAVDHKLVPIDWTVEPATIGLDAATRPDAPALHDAIADNVLTRGLLKRGDVERAHAAAAATSTGTFETSFVEHAYIEPEAGWAERRGDRIYVAACTQAPYMDREDVARVLGIAEARVEIAPTACGGGFGGKLDVSVQPILAIAAWTLGVPVRLVYSRAESMAATTKRHPARITAKASADAQGHLLAYEMDGDFNTGAYASWGPTVANRVPIHAYGPYRVANVHNRTRAIFTNEAPAGAFRGFGVPQSAIANETLMDDLAARLGIDRWQIRRINALGKGDTTASGQLLAHSAGLPLCLDALKPAWDAAVAAADLHNAEQQRHRRGVGIACMWYGCGNTALPNPSEMRVALGRDGQVTIWSGAVDIGQGVSTILVQIVREALALTGANVTVCEQVGNTALTLDAGKTSASRQTFVTGNAARLAALDLRAQILRHANVGDDARLALDGDAIAVAGAGGSRRIPLRDLVAGDDVGGFGRYDPPTTPLDANGQGVPYATYGFAAQIAEVMVDTALGATRVLHIHAAHDVGRAINPMQVEGQIHGGIAQGLGLALMEEFISGRTENLHDYLIPTAGDIPPITTHLIEDPDPEGPFGAKGVGEPALIATAPAILGAIRHATGVTVRKVPVLPHRLWEALNAQGGRTSS